MTTLNDVWGSSANDLYVAGYYGFNNVGCFIHSSGSGAWTQQLTTSPEVLWGGWGSGANDVYAVGGGGTVVHRVSGTNTITGLITVTANPTAKRGGRFAGRRSGSSNARKCPHGTSTR